MCSIMARHAHRNCHKEPWFTRTFDLDKAPATRITTVAGLCTGSQWCTEPFLGAELRRQVTMVRTCALPELGQSKYYHNHDCNDYLHDTAHSTTSVSSPAASLAWPTSAHPSPRTLGKPVDHRGTRRTRRPPAFFNQQYLNACTISTEAMCLKGMPCEREHPD